MRYASIRNMDISNGEKVGVALFVQGCNFHCYNCFNKETWDFNGGNEWTPEIEDKFIELASRPYIKRISILGGEPLANENFDTVLNLVNRIRLLMPEKTIWLYSGFTWEEIQKGCANGKIKYGMWKVKFETHMKRQEILEKVDIFVDGRYIDSQRNPSAKWKGSDNQRVIDVKKSLEQNQIVLWEN